MIQPSSKRRILFPFFFSFFFHTCIIQVLSRCVFVVNIGGFGETSSCSDRWIELCLISSMHKRDFICWRERLMFSVGVLPPRSYGMLSINISSARTPTVFGSGRTPRSDHTVMFYIDDAFEGGPYRHRCHTSLQVKSTAAKNPSLPHSGWLEMIIMPGECLANPAMGEQTGHASQGLSLSVPNARPRAQKMVRGINILYRYLSFLHGSW